MNSYSSARWRGSKLGNRISRAQLEAKAAAALGPDCRPIRLIDVEATINGSSKGSICFTASHHGWDFHVISHTWSLDVRNLSEKIGNSVLLKSCKMLAADAYNEAFKESDFSKDPCYKLLIDFLQLLVLEGVKQVWFDALCINQVDRQEKAKEIGNMGAYYNRSRGCYVILHGLGQGYRLWTEDDLLPRWFTRVWTFQEFMLPKRLTFIVEGLDRRLIAYVNREIITKSRSGLCQCFAQRVGPGEVVPLWGSASNARWWSFVASPMDTKEWEMEQDACTHVDALHNAAGAELLICSESNEPCVECGSLAMIRRVQATGVDGIFQKVQDAAQLYMVDREAYIGVMQFLPSLRRTEKLDAGVSTLNSLYTMFLHKRLKPDWSLRYTIAEIRTRQCSVEEDRVLSILALLGVHLSQLRTGEGLQKQLMELAKVCDEEMLVELCMMDAKSNATVGMSWAPDLTENTGADNSWHRFIMRTRRCEMDAEVEKLQVSDMGSLNLSAKVISGVVIPVSALPSTLSNKETLFHKNFLNCRQPPTHFLVVPPSQCKFNTYVQLQKCSFLPLDLNVIEISTAKSFVLSFEIHWSAREASNVGQFQVPLTIKNHAGDLDLKCLAVSFEVQMVVLGTGDASGLGEKLLSKVVMVCLNNSTDGKEKEELHKIGMLSLAEQTQKYGSDMDMTTFSKSSSRRNCLISGFGADLSAHIEWSVEGRV